MTYNRDDLLDIIENIKIVESDKRTTVKFNAGKKGNCEKGDYDFWTCIGEDEYGDWKIITRCMNLYSPRDRLALFREQKLFDSQEDYSVHNNAVKYSYSALCNRLYSAKYLRASNYREVAEWMSEHIFDNLYVEPGWVCQGKEIFGLPPRDII